MPTDTPNTWDDLETHQCAECGKTFETRRSLEGHRAGAQHQIDGPVMRASMLTRALRRLRFGRDRDGDGHLDITRRSLYLQLGVLATGTIVGHTLAHDPTAAYQVVTAAAALVWGGRAAASVSVVPLRPEWFDSKAMTQLGVGMIFGAALVLIPWHMALDAVSHAMGDGHAPGAHTHP